MRILLLSPTALPAVTGNALTAERWRRALEEKGVIAKVLATAGLGASVLEKEVERFQPAVIHAHHALRAGCLLLDLPVPNSGSPLPWVVSPAGTDINGDSRNGLQREVLSRVFHSARAIIAQGPATLQRLGEILPQLNGRIFPVPKSVAWFGEEKVRLREWAGCRPGDILFFLPAGIRPVKRSLECLMDLEKVHSARPGVRAVFAGPPLDGEYASRFEREVRRCAAFARWIPLLPPAAMRSAYEAADVVLNASLSEGLANSLLEAMAAGRPLLASDIPGNRAPVLGEKEEDEPSALLFDLHDPEDFPRQAIRLIDDENLRSALGLAGKKRAAGWPSPGDEAEGLIRAYEFALPSSGGKRVLTG
jgi:glycosyltransferase involved in cell wall biosynthesis